VVAGASCIMEVVETADIKKIVADIFLAALSSVDPYGLVHEHTDELRVLFQRGGYERLIAAGFGKASCPMAKALEDSLSDIVDTALVITKYGHCGGYVFEKVRVNEAGHPLPDESGVKATREIVDVLKSADEHTLVVCLISGGGSALLVSPYESLTLAHKQQVTGLLLRAGADIYELNTVRKHISAVKGGRLAEIAYPAGVISLIVSDVMGDRLDVIASGPTAPDDTTYEGSLRIVEKYGLAEKVPSQVLDVLSKGRDGLIPETPNGKSPVFERVENLIIGSNVKALNAAMAKGGSLGFQVEILSSNISGEAREVGRALAGKAINVKKDRRPGGRYCIISGGETTVTVTGSGLGGRNTELALSFAMEIEGMEGVTLLSAGTDGTDGPTDAAGAIVDGKTAGRARAAGLDPREYLDNNDSYNFFRKIDGLYITGPTGTNVMDIQIVVIES
jgi:glycerate 2-kinase